MLDRSEYTICSTLHEGFQTTIYRLHIPNPPNSAILKLLKLEYPPIEAIIRLKHEYQIQKNFNDPGIVKAYSLDTFEGRLGLLLEDFGGISLKQMLSTPKMSIASFLSVAVQLAKALISVQQYQIIHKDIKPANIIINPTNGIVKLTDFSMASVLSSAKPQLIDPDQIEGTLAYMSPEQTGRMNRTLDYRSDFYSLGVTFYEMLTGQLPFQSNDPLEIIYCHLGKQPLSVQELNSEIPDTIAQIVGKMMAKNAEDRYQNAAGMLTDLQHCFDNLKTTVKIENAPMNFQYKDDLAEAERCRMLGQTYEAMELYDRAIQRAAENGCIEAEALANEIAAKFYLELGKKKIAKAYMTDAYFGYDRSGYTAQAKHLEQHYPDLIFAIPKTADNSELAMAANIGLAKTTSSTTSSRILDLVSVMKASETIQNEITSDNLPGTLLHILLESAGAQKGCLILVKNDRLFIEAIDNGQELSEIVLQYTPLETSKDVPISLIDRVAKTQQPTVLNNVIAESIYQTDPYIQRQQPKSALCAPIFYRGKLIGIFYLENNLTTNAFTIARLELLELLASQAAIALKNARLYACEQEKSKQLQQKEAQYRSIFEASNDGLAICDLETYKFIDANPANCRIYGYEVEEWLNLAPTDYIHPDSLHLFGEFIKIVEAGEDFCCEAVVIRKDGTQLEIEVRGTPYTYNGKPHALCIARDISDRKKAENALRHSETQLAQQKQTLKAILNAAPIWIWMTNLNGKMQFVNKTLCANVGVPVSRFIESEHYREVLGEEIASNCIASDKACMAQETPHFSVELLPFVDGKIHNVEVTKTQIKDTQGQTIGIIGLGVDATDRAQAKLMLQEKNQHLEQALQELQQAQTQLIQNEKMSALGNLVAGVAHEINNPIGFLSGSINNIEEYIQYLFGHLDCYQRCYPNPLPAIEESAEDIDLEFLIEDFPKIFSSMKVAVDRIGNISTSLRTFSRADSDRKIACNIHEGIDSTLLILKYRLKANEQHPEIKIIKQYGELPLIECFSGQLNQVFMNILANAIDSIEESNHGRTFAEIKANPNTIEVKTELGEDNQTVIIKIQDSGKGMSEEVKARVFDHLFTTKGVGKGTGLGLSISREIVEETHGGSLKCSSVLGEGTEFAIALPLGIAVDS